MASAIRAGEIEVEILGTWQFTKKALKHYSLGETLFTKAFMADGNTVYVRQAHFRTSEIYGLVVHEGTHVLDVLSKRHAGRTRWGLETRAWSAELEFNRKIGVDMRPLMTTYEEVRKHIRKVYLQKRYE